MSQVEIEAPQKPSRSRYYVKDTDVARLRKEAGRSGVTNGGRNFIADGDGRSVWARRWRDLVSLHLDDLGGEAFVSAAQFAMAKRAATLEIELEQQEATLSSGGSIDLDAYNRIAGGLRRILEVLGMTKVVKPPPGPQGLGAIASAIEEGE